MDLQTIYWLQAVVAAALAVFVTVYLWRHRAMLSARLLMALLLEAAAWSLTCGLEYTSPTLASRLLWVKLEYLTGVWVAPTILAFTFCVTGLERWVSWRRLWPLGLLPLFTVLAAFTNSHYHLLWGAARLEQRGPALVTLLERGPVFWVYLTYAYLLLMVSSFILVRTFLRARHLHRRQLGVVLLGIGIPWIVNALYFARIEPFYYVDLTPLAFSMVGLSLTWGLFRTRLVDLIPLAREALLDNLPDPVMVLDSQDRLVDMNSAAHTLLGGERELIGRPAAEMFPGHSRFAELLASAQELQAELDMEWQGVRRGFELRSTKLRDLRGTTVGRFLILRDITQRLLAQEELSATRNATVPPSSTPAPP